MVSKCRLPLGQTQKPAPKGFDAQGLAGQGRLVAGAAAGGAVRAGGVRRRTQFHPQDGCTASPLRLVRFRWQTAQDASGGIGTVKSLGLLALRPARE